MALFSLTFFCFALCIHAQTAEPGGAQSTAPQGNPPGVATPPIQVAVSGCLRRANDGGYRLSDQNGNTWILSSSKVNLAEHINHSVTLTGKPGALTSPQESNTQQSGTTAGGNRTHRLQVLTLDVLDVSCTR
jgi:hypothetical protein